MSRLLILASKLGYQMRSFAETARALGVEVVFASDRCHQLEDPWSDGAIPVRFDQPEDAARRIVQQSLVRPIDGLIALGDRATTTAAFAARALGIEYNSRNRWKIAAANCASAKSCGTQAFPCPDFSHSASINAWKKFCPACNSRAWSNPCALRPAKA